MSKFSLFSYTYILLAAVLFFPLESILIADKAGTFFLIAFFYASISGIWSIFNSSLIQFLIFSALHLPLGLIMSQGADQNMFGPGRDEVVLITVVSYFVFLIFWLGVKILKKEFQK